MLMGNSAHAFYPVAAQGFNLSVRDVCAFSESLAARIKQGDAFGACVQDPHFFEAYYDARKSDWKRTQQYVAKAEQWGTSPLRAPLLAKALMLLDCLPDVAKPFLRHTTGMALRSRILSGLDLV